MTTRIIILSYALSISLLWFNLFAVDYDTPLVNRFGHTGIFFSHSAKTLGMGRLSLATYGNVSRHRDFVISVIDDNPDLSDPAHWIDTLINPNMTISTLNFSAGYGITRYLDFSVMLPFYVEFISEHSPPFKDAFGGETKSGIGDLEFSAKFQYPPYPHKKFFEMAYFGAISIPTGDRDVHPYFPRHNYYFIKDSNEVVNFYTSEFPEIDMKMLWTLDFDELRYGAPVEFHFNYGVRWTHADLDHLFLLNAGLTYKPLNWLTLFTEFSGETKITNIDKGFRIGDDPLRLSPGLTISPIGGFYLTLGMDIDLSSDKKLQYHVLDKSAKKKLITTEIEPQYRFAVSCGWAGFVMPQDKDKDGIKDDVDKCPNDPEDFDGFEDGDGCPEKDNDGDGIPDSLDKCPNDKEDLDGFEDEDGCPDYDNDGDGVRDIDDKCPIEPEDLDGYEDNDGCPDNDNDADGIPDSLDRCIDQAEDKDGYEDTDGCPDIDNDMDAIPDSIDKCPNQPETFNAFEDEDGCPDTAKEKPKAKEIKRGRVILRGVNFEFGKALLTGDSYIILDQVYASLMEWPEIKVEIRGHTDSVGTKNSNKRLSYRRAQSVRDYLVTQGVASDRLIPVGMGEGEPIADNNTAEGRALNRRVELHRID